MLGRIRKLNPSSLGVGAVLGLGLAVALGAMNHHRNKPVGLHPSPEAALQELAVAYASEGGDPVGIHDVRMLTDQLTDTLQDDSCNDLDPFAMKVEVSLLRAALNFINSVVGIREPKHKTD